MLQNHPDQHKHMDYKISVATGYLDTRPYGFYRFADDYYRAGKLVSKMRCGNRINYPAYFLYTRSIELAMKSVLLASKKFTVDQLRMKLHHDLALILRELTPDFKKKLKITLEDEKVLLTINKWYKTNKKKFEYYDLGTTGIEFLADKNYPDLPRTSVLRTICGKMMNPRVLKYILSNS